MPGEQQAVIESTVTVDIIAGSPTISSTYNSDDRIISGRIYLNALNRLDLRSATGVVSRTTSGVGSRIQGGVCNH